MKGDIMTKGQKLWEHAKRLIPGGNMLLSKQAEMFLPDIWPTYYSKASGCRLWDLNGIEYIDMSIMGIGTNTLGYCQPEVDESVRKAIDQGNMSTFNCPEEVYLAEKLVEIHPWSDMVRLARTGGEANAIAIRIARAASGKDKVAFCGYHGWHDWYLAANLADDKNLDGHLLSGLEPNGVPRGLKGSVLPFTYNSLDELETLFKNHDIGVIIMEVVRNIEPEDNFIHHVRELANKRNVVLIFDEISSGFRQTLGGIHKQYKVQPDIATFGKALGNGYAISAVLGTQQIMDACQTSFISSTFWTERIGPAAALKTLDVMQKIKSWERITEKGHYIQKSWIEIAGKYGLDIEVGGLPAMSYFSFKSDNFLEYKTLITQEMLKKGFLSTNIIFLCTEHHHDIIEAYIAELDAVFRLISECEDGRNVTELLDGPVCHNGFKRLN